MQKIVFTVIVVLLCSRLAAQSNADNIKGIWQNEQKTIKIEFYKTGDEYLAKVVWMQTPNLANGKPKLDIHNPNPALRGKPILGLVIISCLKFDGKIYRSGKIYAPQKGITADCSIAMNGSDKIAVTAKKSFFSDTKIWTRQK